jgi:integrase
MPELASHLKPVVERAGFACPTLLKLFQRDPTELSSLLCRVFRAAKVNDTEHGKASFHSLRSTFITRMDEVGSPSRVTDIITGHAPKSMHDRYSHPDFELARSWMLQALPPLLTDSAAPVAAKSSAS